MTSEELTIFRKWFAEFDAEMWDRQIETDIRAGNLDSLAQKALRDRRTSFAELARQQGVRPVERLEELSGGWPEDQLDDGFEEALERWRDGGLPQNET